MEIHRLEAGRSRGSPDIVSEIPSSEAASNRRYQTPSGRLQKYPGVFLNTGVENVNSNDNHQKNTMQKERIFKMCIFQIGQCNRLTHTLSLSAFMAAPFKVTLERAGRHEVLLQILGLHGSSESSWMSAVRKRETRCPISGVPQLQVSEFLAQRL